MDIRKGTAAALKGFGMGAGTVTPCVSAGTIALLTGIYQPLLDSLNSLSDPGTWKALFSGKFSDFWKRINGTFLCEVMAGFVISVLALAKFVTWGLETWPIQTWSFFFGLIIASTVLLLKGVENLCWKDSLFILVGVALGVGISSLPTADNASDSLLYIFVCGAVSVCSMILPGIAGSFILKVMGEYEHILKAMDFENPQILLLLVFILGCVVGILAFSKFLKWLMSKWEKPTLLVLTGFVVGSLVKIWPYSDMEAVAAAQVRRTGLAEPIDFQIPGAVLWCIIGVLVVVLLMIASALMKGYGKESEQ